MLNTKKKLNNLFENIPARMRKELFNDNPMEFVNAYVTNDEKKLTELSKVGLVSQSQLETVKNYNANIKKINEENKIRQKFIAELEKQKEGLYDTFKATGNINLNNIQNNETGNADIQTGV